MLKAENTENKIFSFNLHPTIANAVCNGEVLLKNNCLVVLCDGKETKSINTANIKELITELGVGCVFVSYKDQNDIIHLICRLDMKNSKTVIKTVRAINKNIKNGSFLVERQEVKRCPKCSRIIKEGKTRCPVCYDKRRNVKRLWGLFSEHKFFMFSAIVLFFAGSGINLLLPYVNKIAVDDYIQAVPGKAISTQSFALVMLSMLVLQLLMRVLSSVRSHLLVLASEKMKVNLRNQLFKKIGSLSLAKFGAYSTGDLMYRIGGDVNEIEGFVVNYLPNVLQQVVVFLLVGIYLFCYDPLLFLLIMLPTPFVILSFNLFWKFVRVLYSKRHYHGQKTNSILHDIFSGIRVVKAFGMEKRESERFRESSTEEKEMQKKTDCFWSIVMPILRFFISFGEFIILYYVGNKILNGSMTLGEMAQFSSYASLVYGPLRMIALIPRHLMRFNVSSTKIFEILDEEEDLPEAKEPINLNIKGDIDINNVSFGYDETKEVLRNVDLHFKQGEFIGLVGASGVGKSTLINLIMRLYDVEEGSITIDGVNIKDIKGEDLRSQMGVVLQETYLFKGTVAQNIAYSKPSATHDEIIAAAKLAGCHSFIMRLPDGYNTMVGEKGLTLSGGERQRVAIARALLHNPRILILDEATASLDTETEKQIQEALANLSKGRTTIAIAHRLSTLRNATRLVVLDKGKVAEVGTHEELLKKGGIYHSLVMAQREMSNIEE